MSVTESEDLPREGKCKWCNQDVFLVRVNGKLMYFDVKSSGMCPERQIFEKHELEGVSSEVRKLPFKATLPPLTNLQPATELEMYEDELGMRGVITEILHYNEEVLNKARDVLISLGMTEGQALHALAEINRAGIVFRKNSAR